MATKQEHSTAKCFEHDEDANTIKFKPCGKVFELKATILQISKYLNKKGHEELLKEFETLEEKHKAKRSPNDKFFPYVSIFWESQSLFSLLLECE